MDQTIQDLDEETDQRLQKVLSLLPNNSDNKIQLGVWLITGKINWPDYQHLCLHFHCIEPARKNQEYCPNLFNLLLEKRRKQYSIQDAMFIWQAQQTYRIILAFYSEEDQMKIFHRIQKTKNLHVAGLTNP